MQSSDLVEVYLMFSNHVKQGLVTTRCPPIPKAGRALKLKETVGKNKELK